MVRSRAKSGVILKKTRLTVFKGPIFFSLLVDIRTQNMFYIECLI